MAKPTTSIPRTPSETGIAPPGWVDGLETATCVLDPSNILVNTHLPARNPAPVRVEGYDLLEAIGAGGMGVVYKARHRRLNRVVALKILGRDALADPDSHKRFQAEAEAVARLQHPNIIQVFDVGAFEERPGSGVHSPYLTLEYVDGGSLYKQTFAPQTPEQAARLVEKLARAVHAAHRVGVIHRDLKPANVLMTRDGEPKVADFGLAKQTEAARDPRGRYLTQAGVVMGTPEYMAPEQVDGAPAAPSFDIYALGVILYELLTARVPFQGLTLTETMLLVKYEEPVSPRRLQPNLPRDLETVCLKCLEKSPAARYATAEELADDLGRWAAGETIRARPASRPERACRWARRNPTVAALSAAVFALAALAVGGVTWKWRDAEWHAQNAEARAEEAQERNLAARWELYRSNLAVASVGLKLNTLTSTREALDRAPEEHRNWEWRYYRRQMDSARRVVPLPDSGVAIAHHLQPADRLIVHHDGGGRVWDIGTGREAWSLRHADVPHGWLIAPDGKGYAYRRADGTLAVRPRFDEPDEVVLAGHATPIQPVQFSADGRRLLTNSDDRVSYVWDTTTGKAVAAFREFTGLIGTSALSPDGRLAATHDMDSRNMFIWDAATGEKLQAIPDLSNLFDVWFSPDGGHLLVNEAYPSSRVRVWDARTGRPAGELDGHTNNVKHWAFSPDGRLLATGSTDQTVCVWDAATWKLRATLCGHNGVVTGVAFNADGTRLVSGSDDLTARLWNPVAGTELAVLRGHTGGLVGVAFTADGAEVVSVARDGTLRYWDARAAAENGVCRGHTKFVYQVAYHPDGRHVVSAAWDGTARVWDTATGREVRRFAADDKALHAVAVSPNGKRVATIARDNAVHLWDFDTGDLLHTWTLPTDHYKTGRLAFHPTADLLAVGCVDGGVRVLDVVTRKQVAELKWNGDKSSDVGHRDAVNDVAFSPDGRWLVSGAADADKTARVWDTATWEQVAVLRGHADAVHSLAFSRDGKALATGSADGTARLWDTAAWELTGKLPHGVKVYGLAFSKDGTRLASGCADNTVRLWDVARRDEVAELRGHTDYVHSVAFSPDGTRLVSGSGDHTVRTWDSAPAGDRRTGE